MKSVLVLLIICFAAFLSGGCGKRYTKTETTEHRINVTGKKKIKIDNISGTVSIAKSDDSSSINVKAYKEVKVKKKYLNTPFDEIEVKLDTISNVVTITTEIENQGEDEIFKFNLDRKQRVDYEIQVPSNIEVEIENVNGNITAENLNNDMKIDLIHGKVDIEKYTGLLECEITNGSFSGKIDSSRGININTVNGGVTLFLNNYMNANLRAETVNGRISEENLDFSNVIKERNLFKGKLGSGEATIDIRIETVNGKIKLFGRNEI